VLSVYVPAESALASGEYSVVVSANQPVAAVSNFSDADSGAAYSGAEAGALSWGFPLYMITTMDITQKFTPKMLLLLPNLSH
jgi:hypothetical protein